MIANQKAASSAQNADNLIHMTDRLSQLMEQEVELLRSRRASDIRALQSDKESLAAVYQRVINDLEQNPGALEGIDDLRRQRLSQAVTRLQNAATGNAIALRSSIEANHQMMEAIAAAIREQSTADAPYMANGRIANGGGPAKQNLSVSLNDTL